MDSSIKDRFEIRYGWMADGFMTIWYYIDKTNGQRVYPEELERYILTLSEESDD